MVTISGSLLPPGGTTATSAATAATTSGLQVGSLLTARVSQVQGNGQGVLRFADGSGFSYSGGHNLRVGEPVQLEVLRLAPEISLRLMASNSGSAAGLAQSAEQSLMRAPDLFARLMNWAGLSNTGGVLTGSSPEDALFFALRSSLKSSVLTTSKGEGLAQVLGRTLPNVSAEGLARGEVSALARLLDGGSRQDVAEAIRQLRQAAVDLRPGPGSGGEAGATSTESATELNAARNALHRLGDLLAMQEVLPRAAPSLDGDQFLGYRLFWLTEGGLGEAIWRREQARKRSQNDADDPVTTILLSLNMTGLGTVQARLSYTEKQLLVAISAEDETALAALRSRIGELRGGLLAEELPLRSLEISRLLGSEMKQERLKALGLGAGFSTEV